MSEQAPRHPHSADAAEAPVDLSIGRLAFGWLLVGIPLCYGVVTTLSRVGQLFS